MKLSDSFTCENSFQAFDVYLDTDTGGILIAICSSSAEGAIFGLSAQQATELAKWLVFNLKLPPHPPAGEKP